MTTHYFAKLASALFLGIALMVFSSMLVSCGAEPTNDTPNTHPGLHEEQVHLKDGRTVTCVRMWDKGVSCDWGSSNR